MREKLALVLGLAAVAMLALLILQLAASWVAPGLGFYFNLWAVDLAVYAISMVALFVAAGALGRYLTPTPPSLDALRASMLATGAGVIGGALLVLAGLAELLGAELTTQLAAIALGFAAVPALFSWLLSPIIINFSYGCKPDSYLQDMVSRIASRSGMKPPKAVIARMKEPNAFAYSSPLFGRYVAVTEGMLNLASREELEAVIGHELGHHKHRDNTVMLVFGLVPAFVYFLGRYLMLAGTFSRSSYYGERRGGNAGWLLLLAGIALIIVSVVMQLLVLALSRLREYYADLHGAKVTSPNAMISALQKLDAFYKRYRGALAEVSASKLKMLYIYALASPVFSLEELFATHPSIEKRVAFLRSLVGAI
uniref:Protease HtpX homolog n=1 Tax=Thermofilum pendens TaxID=2269 RepID=A0A7C4B9R4_THEPE